MSEFLKRLSQIYGSRQEPDMFGRRPATPNEVKQAIEPIVTFEQGLERYLPTDADVREKDSNDRRQDKGGRPKG